MASKKDFKGKKPANAIEAAAVEAFLETTVQNTAEQQPEPEQTVNNPVPLSPVSSPASARIRKAEKREIRLQVLLTPRARHYLDTMAWIKRTSVNDYVNYLIEQDIKNNKNASAYEMEYDRGFKA